MKFLKEVKVYYHDTDSYGIVWHGNYLKWYEQARCDLCDELGFPLDKLAENSGIIFPIININLRYKSAAKLYDNLIIETEIKEFTRAKIVFEQIMKNKENETVYNIAEITAVATDLNGKLIRHMPEDLRAAFEKAM